MAACPIGDTPGGCEWVMVVFFGGIGRGLLLLALVPNLILWVRLGRFPGGVPWAVALAAALLSTVAWSGGGARFREWQRHREWEARRAEQDRKLASPAYHQRHASDLARCQQDNKACWQLGDAYRADGPREAFEFFIICCNGGDENCCAMMSGLQAEMSDP